MKIDGHLLLAAPMRLFIRKTKCCAFNMPVKNLAIHIVNEAVKESGIIHYALILCINHIIAHF